MPRKPSWVHGMRNMAGTRLVQTAQVFAATILNLLAKLRIDTLWTSICPISIAQGFIVFLLPPL